MEVRTGNYILLKGAYALFISRKAAEKVVKSYNCPDYKVYGVTRQHLKMICELAKMSEMKLMVIPFLSSSLSGETGDVSVISYSAPNIEADYL